MRRIRNRRPQAGSEQERTRKSGRAVSESVSEYVRECMLCMREERRGAAQRESERVRERERGREKGRERESE